MNRAFGPSHYLIRVENLKQAVDDYEAAGFRIVWGSDPSVAHNALIYFQSGGFLELFNPRVDGIVGTAQSVIARAGAALGRPILTRLHRWVGARGLCDYAIETEGPLPEAADTARARGARLTKVRNFSRVQADGSTTRWQLCSAHTADLPFMMGPYDPAPAVTPEQREHPNGLRHLTGMRIGTPDPERYAQDLSVLLGEAQIEHAGASIGVRLKDFVFEIEHRNTHAPLAMLVGEPVPAAGALHGLELERRTL